ncbi:MULTISPECIES: EVE domain-containing protein [Rickettsiales]|uniref:EVE domain-containing protein n=1 Tax=unclassified Wolbachia TaxID=2640676 RepID=UPI00209E2476|nr:MULTISPECIES: EVE domain-containing protein [Rickettsiales]MBV2146491.1 EVE domain-containing protein [Wolbachia endosymbiont of Pissodes strobi]WMT84031.1 EVE domain-containing protein [Wolbachia endosymbiont of Listronotus oregonensis]
MQLWLLKSEPSEYSWQKMEKEQVVEWDGVRNYQAQNYMKIMKVSDLAFFYHTGKEKAILGIVEVFKEYYHINDPKFGLVNVKFLKPLNNQVTLNNIKQNPLLKNMSILKQPRLSIAPVSEIEWNEVIRMSEC